MCPVYKNVKTKLRCSNSLNFVMFENIIYYLSNGKNAYLMQNLMHLAKLSFYFLQHTFHVAEVSDRQYVTVSKSAHLSKLAL